MQTAFVCAHCDGIAARNPGRTQLRQLVDLNLDVLLYNGARVKRNTNNATVTQTRRASIQVKRGRGGGRPEEGGTKVQDQLKSHMNPVADFTHV